MGINKTNKKQHKTLDAAEKWLGSVLNRLVFIKWPCFIAAIISFLWYITTGVRIYHYIAAVLIITSVAILDSQEGQGFVVDKIDGGE